MPLPIPVGMVTVVLCWCVVWPLARAVLEWVPSTWLMPGATRRIELLDAGAEPGPEPEPGSGDQKTTLRLVGTVPPEVWNRFGIKILPKLRSGDDLSVGIEFSVSVGSAFAKNMETELRQILNDLGLGDRVRVERS